MCYFVLWHKYIYNQTLFKTILAFLKSFNKTPSSPISANDNTKGLEGAIEEMTKEIRELRKDIKELKEELKE